MSTTPTILCADPKAQYQAHAQEIQAAISRVLESGWYILGQEVQYFEQEFANFIGVDHGIGVANGTDAIAIALRAGGINPGDEVITVSHSAVATVAAIEQIGAIPVFCDLDAQSRCMDPALLPGLISNKTRAIVPVHIYGHPADIKAICAVAKQYGLFVVEDCAQAHGASVDGQTVGSFGDIAAFSFYPTKNLGAIGDGGGIVTNNSALAERARMLRQYGWRERYMSDCTGVNSRLDEMQAAILRVKLTYLKADNKRRNQIADMYDAALADTTIKCPHRSSNFTHAMHLYVVEHPERDLLKTFLLEHGIQAAMHYPLAIHQQSAYKERELRGSAHLSVTEHLYTQILSLPMYPELTDSQVQKVIETTHAWLKQKN